MYEWSPVITLNLSMDLRWPMDQDLRMNGLWTLGNYPSQTFKSFFIFPFCWTSGRCSWINIGSHVQRLVHQTYKVYSLSLRSPVSWTKTKKKKEVGPEMRLVMHYELRIDATAESPVIYCLYVSGGDSGDVAINNMSHLWTHRSFLLVSCFLSPSGL